MTGKVGMFTAYEFYNFLSPLNKMNEGDIHNGLMVDIGVWRIIIKIVIIYFIMAFSKFYLGSPICSCQQNFAALVFCCIKFNFPQ